MSVISSYYYQKNKLIYKKVPTFQVLTILFWSTCFSKNYTQETGNWEITGLVHSAVNRSFPALLQSRKKVIKIVCFLVRKGFNQKTVFTVVLKKNLAFGSTFFMSHSALNRFPISVFPYLNKIWRTNSHFLTIFPTLNRSKRILIMCSAIYD